MGAIFGGVAGAGWMIGFGSIFIPNPGPMIFTWVMAAALTGGLIGNWLTGGK